MKAHNIPVPGLPANQKYCVLPNTGCCEHRCSHLQNSVLQECWVTSGHTGKGRNKPTVVHQSLHTHAIVSGLGTYPEKKQASGQTCQTACYEVGCVWVTAHLCDCGVSGAQLASPQHLLASVGAHIRRSTAAALRERATELVRPEPAKFACHKILTTIYNCFTLAEMIQLRETMNRESQCNHFHCCIVLHLMTGGCHIMQDGCSDGQIMLSGTSP